MYYIYVHFATLYFYYLHSDIYTLFYRYSYKTRECTHYSIVSSQSIIGLFVYKEIGSIEKQEFSLNK